MFVILANRFNGYTKCFLRIIPERIEDYDFVSLAEPAGRLKQGLRP
jgi:hypothetical protein